MADGNRVFSRPAVRVWMAVQVVGLLAWIGVAFVLSLLGLDFVPLLVLLVLVALGISFLIDPRRTWWGPGPAEVMTDRLLVRRYRVVMTVWLVAALIVGFVLITGIVATGASAPA